MSILQSIIGQKQILLSFKGKRLVQTKCSNSKHTDIHLRWPQEKVLSSLYLATAIMLVDLPTLLNNSASKVMTLLALIKEDLAGVKDHEATMKTFKLLLMTSLNSVRNMINTSIKIKHHGF